MRCLLRMQDLALPGWWSPSHSSSLNRDVGSRGQGIVVDKRRCKTMEDTTLLSSLVPEDEVRRCYQSVNCAGRDVESHVCLHHLLLLKKSLSQASVPLITHKRLELRLTRKRTPPFRVRNIVKWFLKLKINLYQIILGLVRLTLPSWAPSCPSFITTPRLSPLLRSKCLRKWTPTLRWRKS